MIHTARPPAEEVAPTGTQEVLDGYVTFSGPSPVLRNHAADFWALVGDATLDH